MKQTNKRESGILINRARKGRYCCEEDIKNVILYAVRQREFETRADELVSWGAFGLPEWESVEGIIDTFRFPQRCYQRKGAFGRYLDHEVYDFSPFEEETIEHYGVDIDTIGRAMAKNVYKDGYQVLYAVHRKSDQESSHVHLIINTVNFKTGNKRQENKKATAARKVIFHDIVSREIRRANSKGRLLKRAFCNQSNS